MTIKRSPETIEAQKAIAAYEVITNAINQLITKDYQVIIEEAWWPDHEGVVYRVIVTDNQKFITQAEGTVLSEALAEACASIPRDETSSPDAA